MLHAGSRLLGVVRRRHRDGAASAAWKLFGRDVAIDPDQEPAREVRAA